jgi:nucleoside-diphosphate-sugar epimerase
MWHLTDVEVEWVDAGRGGEERWAELARGCRGAVVASEPVPRVEPARMMGEAVGRTRALCRGLASAGVGRVVYRTHACALGGAPGEEVDEASYREVREGDDPWAAAALAAEEEIYLEWGSGLEVVFVAPTVVVGPGDAWGTQAGAWLRRVAAGKERVVLGAPVDVVDARDVARAMAAALDAGRPGRRYTVGGHATTIGEVAAAVSARSGGAPPRVVSWAPEVPRAWRGEFEGRTWGALRRAPARYDTSRARGELGHKPRPMEKTLSEALAWYDAYGGELPGGFRAPW